METSKTTNSKIRKAADNKRALLAVERIVLECGVRADLNGCAYLTEAATVYAACPDAKLTDIYGAVGSRHGVKPKTVMREINYAVAQAFDVAEKLSALIGVRIPPAQVHGGLIIAYIGKLYSNPDLRRRDKTNGGAR